MLFLCTESVISPDSACARVSSKQSVISDNSVNRLESVSETRVKCEDDVQPHHQKNIKNADSMVTKDLCDITKVCALSHFYTSGHTPVHSPIRALPFSPSQVLVTCYKS